MFTIENAQLVLKDKNGNVARIQNLGPNDIAKIHNAISDIGKLVNPVSHLPIKATANTVGVVQLADDEAIAAGTTGRVVDAKQLQDAVMGVSPANCVTNVAAGSTANKIKVTKDGGYTTTIVIDNVGHADTATSADSVAWVNVSGKPSSYTPSSHTHDDRYYTESEIDTKLNGKANTSGTYSSLNVGYATSAGNGVPVGSVFYFASDSVPSGYLVCNGGAVSRTTYANLFNIIGAKYGSGNGSTTFNVPNLIDRFIQGNSTTGLIKSPGLPNITGDISIGDMNGISYVIATGESETGSLRRKGNTTVVSYATETIRDPTNSGYGVSINANYSSSIYGNSNTVQPPAVTLLPCIKY